MARDARVLSPTKVDARVVSHKTRDYAAYPPREKTCKTSKKNKRPNSIKGSLAKAFPQ